MNLSGIKGAFLAILILGGVTCAIAQFSPPKHIALETCPYGTIQASGDIDSDGDIDIVTAGSRNVVLFLNDGGARFVNVEIILDGEYIGIFDGVVLMVDVDNDGALDVLVQDSPPDQTFGWGSVLWVRNLGSGHFGVPVAIPGIPVNGRIVGFDDVDSDGVEDMLLHVAPNSLRRKSNLGNGLFGPDVQLTTLEGTVSAADFDGDNYLDLAQRVSGSITLHRGNGDGTFLQSINATINNNYNWVMDVDGDGFDDLLDYTSSGDLRWRRSVGDGSFNAWAFTFDFPIITIRDIGFVDLNSDGWRDLLVVSDQNLQYALNQGDYTFTTLTVLAPEFTVTIAGGGSTFYLCDADAGGSEELFIEHGEILSEYRFPGNGTMEYVQDLTESFFENLDLLEPMRLNTDEFPDIVYGHTNSYSLNGYAGATGGGFGQFRNLVHYLDPVREAKAIADMDGDGDDDLLLLGDSLQVFTNDGSGVFSATASLNIPSANYNSTITAYDLDEDGDQDLFITVASRVRIVRNNGNGTYTLLPVLAFLNLEYMDVMGFLDADSDGDDDMIIRGGSWTTIQWVRNVGGLIFDARGTISGISGDRGVDIADADLDGDLDIFAFSGEQTSTSVRFVRNQGNGTFSTPEIVLEGPGNGVSYPRAFDVDRDGDPDVVIPLSDSGGSMLLNDGSGTFSDAVPLTGFDIGLMTYFSWKPVDVDLDGDKDILFIGQNDSGFDSRTSLSWCENFFADPFQLSGTVYADLNGNGERDGNEPDLPGATIVADPVGYIAPGTSEGTYLLYCGAEEQSVSAVPPGSLWSQSSTPSTYSVQPTPAQPTWPGLDFGFQPVVDASSISAEIVLASAPCSDQTSLWITYTNAGTRIEHGTVQFQLAQSFGFVSSEPAPSSITGNIITWAFEDLGFFETAIIHLVVTMPNVEYIGDAFGHVATITTLDDIGGISGTFSTVFDGTVTCAYDPNDKLVDPVGYGSMGAVQIDTEELEYTIRFQNTGNAPAVNVMLRDQLDQNAIPATLRVIGYSHTPVEVNIEAGNELVVRFNDILLPDSGASFTGSQGFLKFRISLEPGLPHLTQVQNTAEIYFDLNEPVITNTALTTLVDCSLWQAEIDFLTSDLLEATPGDSYQWYLNGQVIPEATEQWLFPTELGSYSVSVTSSYGCQSMTGSLVFTSLIDMEAGIQRCLVIPNPFAEIATRWAGYVGTTSVSNTRTARPALSPRTDTGDP